MLSDPQKNNNRQIAIWLLICAAVIFCMIVLGGVTRLTGSGLSMVEWRPIMGILPPITDAQWDEVFDEYKQTPEYKKVNHRMTRDEFKRIFYPEYFHRVLGRVIGMIFFFPFVFFLWQGKVPPSLTPKLWMLFVLGGLQGLLGWYMVKSGLVDVPRVSQYRLTAHLGLAVIIYAYMIWLAMSLLFYRDYQSENYATDRTMQRTSLALSVLVFFMILSGGLVAGLDAGFAYNTFPLMDGRLFPSGLYNLQPAWLSIFEDITTVQFNHRIFAYCLIVLIVGFAVFSFIRGITGKKRLAVILFLVALILQVLLGIITLLLVVPVSLAAAHQAGAIVLLTASLFTAFCFRYVE
jgi:cytochrome c oxidase assembly protein subunit 15